MKPDIPRTGKYVVAVSGGVDSMVLLDLLTKQAKINLVVAHFDHGIRVESAEDAAFVEAKAKEYELPVETSSGQLGTTTSEAEARAARYEFLRSMQKKHSAGAIITAHHQDDLIETAMLNILRGSGPRGLISILPKADLLRPLLLYRKVEIIDYAKANRLEWREDSTNQDEKLLRNYLRLNILPKLTDAQRNEIVRNIDKVAKNVNEQDKLIATLSHNILKRNIKRYGFSQLPSEVGSELLAYWLRSKNFRDFDSNLINRASMLIRTGSVNSRHNLGGKVDLVLGKIEAQLTVNS